MIQRAMLDEDEDEDTTSPSPTSEPGPSSDTTAADAAPTPAVSAAEPASASVASNETPSPGLIIEDSVAQPGPGQMKKSDFLAQLRTAVCTTTEQALAGTIWSAAGCPWVDHWFGYYSQRDSQQIERALRRYAPETVNVTSASDYIPIICERVRRAIAVWSTTGEVTGVPEGIELPGGGLMGVAGSMMSGIASVGASIASGAENIASSIANVGASAASGIGSALSNIGSVFFKGREGGAREAGNPQAIQGQLGAGRSLDGGVRSHMEAAFGVDFSHVRVHTDAAAAGLSESLNARAFSVGRDVAFGPGEYRPGTLIGDALIAHELAHVVQQGGSSASTQTLQKRGATDDNALEADADVSAVGAVVSMWSGVKGKLANVAQNAMPSTRSGLRLQRCASSQKRATTIPASTTTSPQVARGQEIPDWTAKVNAATDEAAKAKLIRLALGEGIPVEVAGTSDSKFANPDDYQPFPTVNFDINLNSKRAWSNRRGRREKETTHTLKSNYGFSFVGIKDKKRIKYLVLGPTALDARSPDFTRRAYEHELYHVQHHLERRGNDANEELETYTQDFINYFHLLRSYGESWKRPILFYELAEAGPRKAALAQLVDYYKDPRAKNPLIPEEQVEGVKDLFAIWLSQRLNDDEKLSNDIDKTVQQMQLVQDLNTELGKDVNSRLDSLKKKRASGNPPGEKK
jgi:hypothetical protein